MIKKNGQRENEWEWCVDKGRVKRKKEKERKKERKKEKQWRVWVAFGPDGITLKEKQCALKYAREGGEGALTLLQQPTFASEY